MLTSSEIRQQFLAFFEGKGHTIVDSSPVVPHDDPTLMFTNAGMNQFKDVFLGTGSRPYLRAANTQKCIRAGGKHNDLDDVGQDTYHHTFFEMLGNWSFGDYFKREAISWAWELLTQVWGIDKSRLYATVFEGNEADGLPPDTEAQELWKEVTDIDPSHVTRWGKKDNFWEMGDTGPCGPCSEIHIDLTPDKSGASLVNAGDPRVIELWNLVFIQYNRAPDGKLTPLSAKHVDTGLGFERLCAVLQGMQAGEPGSKTNYDTDVFGALFEAIRKRTGAPRYTGLLPHASDPNPSDPNPSDPNPSRDREGAEAEHVHESTGNLPVAYLITFHTYGSWLHGTDRGSVDRDHNVPGTPHLDPDEGRESDESRRLKQEPVELDTRRRAVVETTIQEVAEFRQWSVRALNVRSNHVHVVVSADATPERVMNDFKSYSTRRMVEAGVFPDSTKAWTRHGSTRYLWTERAAMAAGQYVAEAQGPDLPLTDLARINRRASDAVSDQYRATEEPLPHGRGSDRSTDSQTSDPNPSDPKPSRDREGADSASPDQLLVDVTYRVIADHVRCLTFALTDGAIPDNEGRGYVLRRILRRAVRYGRQYLNMHEPFMCDLVAPLIDHMAAAFPELRTAHGGKNVDHVTELIRDEEASFLKTLDRGITLLEDAVRRAIGKAAVVTAPDFGRFVGIELASLEDDPPGTFAARYTLSDRRGTMDRIIYPWYAKRILDERQAVICAEDAFRLHDTFGFPIDLTEQMAEERGLTVDIDGYERLMEEAREDARRHKQARGIPSALSVEGVPNSWGLETDDHLRYETGECDAKIAGWFEAADESFIAYEQGELREGDKANLILDRTCFYAEQGGQVGDTGRIVTSTGVFVVGWTGFFVTFVVHRGRVEEGRIIDGQSARLVVSPSRESTRRNHTSTHIMNWALRQVLGEHVQQKGSLVDPEKTRFDFSNRSPMTDEQITDVERLCREQIEADHQVYTKEVDQAVAREINTLRAVFGEKYPDRVRVVSVGADIDEMLADPKNEKWMQYSVEFCGGTHLKRSGEAERFILISEEGVAKGVRRVVGISGTRALQAEQCGRELVARAESLRGLANLRLGPLPHGRGSDKSDDSEPSGDPKPSRDREGALSSDEVARLQSDLAGVEIPVCDRTKIRGILAELQKTIKRAEKEQAAVAGSAVMDTVATLLESAEEIGGVTIVVGEVPQAPADQVRGAIDWVRQKCEASAVLLAVAGEGRVTLLAGMSKKAVERGLKAGDLIREVAPIVGGKGGGKPDLAQGGGKDPSKIPDVLERAKSWLKSKLGPA